MDAAMLYALEGDATAGAWLRDAALSCWRAAWWMIGLGPVPRDHAQENCSVGHLETAHLSMAGGFGPRSGARGFNAPPKRPKLKPACAKWPSRGRTRWLSHCILRTSTTGAARRSTAWRPRRWC